MSHEFNVASRTRLLTGMKLLTTGFAEYTYAVLIDPTIDLETYNKRILEFVELSLKCSELIQQLDTLIQAEKRVK